jgi:hypothetical protein
MDADKRLLRDLKNRYLTDGEFHSKNSRRKQFRWKNLDGRLFLLLYDILFITKKNIHALIQMGNL